MVDGQGSYYVYILPFCDQMVTQSMQNKSNWGNPSWVKITFLFYVRESGVPSYA